MLQVIFKSMTMKYRDHGIFFYWFSGILVGCIYSAV